MSSIDCSMKIRNISDKRKTLPLSISRMRPGIRLYNESFLKSLVDDNFSPYKRSSHGSIERTRNKEIIKIDRTLVNYLEKLDDLNEKFNSIKVEKAKLQRKINSHIKKYFTIEDYFDNKNSFPSKCFKNSIIKEKLYTKIQSCEKRKNYTNENAFKTNNKKIFLQSSKLLNHSKGIKNSNVERKSKNNTSKINSIFKSNPKKSENKYFDNLEEFECYVKKPFKDIKLHKCNHNQKDLSEEFFIQEEKNSFDESINEEFSAKSQVLLIPNTIKYAQENRNYKKHYLF